LASERVLVTGGAGFIGSELVRQLLAEGHKVVVVDNLVNGRKENLADVLGERCELRVVDLRKKDDLGPLLVGVQTVFHLACLGVRHSIHDPRSNHEVNASATLELLSAAREAKIRRFVHVSSSEVYGTAQRIPMNEDHPTFPTTVYGASKLAGECYARAFHATHGFPSVVLRPFNAYGPRCHHEGDSGEVIPKFILRALASRPLVIFGDGNQTRDFTYVSDTARGMLLAGWAEGAVGRTINLGSGWETSINALASRVAEVVGGKPSTVHEVRRPGDVLRLCADSTRAREILGFEPTVSLEDGLGRLTRWYKGLKESPEVLLDQESVRNWEQPGGLKHA